MVINYASLGLRPVINAAGTFTNLGGSLMPPEVIAAWTDAARHFVNLRDLQQRVGELIAQLLNVEAAMVTTGAAGAILLGTAAAVTRDDATKIARFPQSTDQEVILQRAHRSEYDSQLTTAGVTLVDVETLDDLARAISPKTALMFFMHDADPAGAILREDWIAVARQHRIPTLIDASAGVPPAENVADLCGAGFDLVAISGGKAIRGPNDTGLLLGRRDLIDAARRNNSPNSPTVGRALKVSKEDLMALLAAVERFVALDHAVEWSEMVTRIELIAAAVSGIPGVQCEQIVPRVSNHYPHLIIDWNESHLGLSVQQVADALLLGDPPIVTGRIAWTGQRGLLIAVFTLQPGEVTIVAQRLRAIFETARSQ